MSGNKKELRKAMKRVLKDLGSDKIISSSETCEHKILQSSLYLNSNGICVYLSMTNELQTNEILQSALSNSKKVYIPKIVGSNRTDMQFHEVYSMEQINNFPKSPWGIPEPPDDSQCSTDYAQHLDIVFLPGVAFDRECKRLGHGKGYYGEYLSFSKLSSLIDLLDTFLTALVEQCEQLGKPKPSFVVFVSSSLLT
jgi:5-formyltetrahydrofolate cyclo-ligase